MARHSSFEIPWFKYAAASLSLTAAIAGMAAQFFVTKNSRDSQDISSVRELQLVELSTKVETMRKELAITQKEVAGIRASPLPPGGMSAAVSKLRESGAAIEKRLGTLESAIAAEPAKALSLPMLRRDVDDLRDAHRREIDAIRSELGRNATQSNWVLGLIGASVLTLGVNTFLNVPKEKPSAERTS